MSRTIKFRAWGHREDRDNYEMFYDFSSFDEYFCPWNDGFAVCDHSLMQHTGLKDNNNNGTDLYEDDIVYISGCGNCIVSLCPIVGVVFTEVNDKFGVWDCHDTLMEGDLGQIQGNIHQNPELLKGEYHGNQREDTKIHSS